MKNLLRNTILFLMALPLVALSSCSDEDSSSVPHTQSKFTVTLPEGISDLKIEDQSLQLTNLSTGKTVKYQSLNDVDLMEGLYDCVYSAEVTYTAKNAEGEETTNKGRLSGKAENVEITGKEKNIGIDTYFSADNDDFIFEEIFFSGTLRSSGSQYYGDSYIKIYNNTDHVLYADGVAFCESKFKSTLYFDYSPDIRKDTMTIWSIYVIPGSGKDHPVMPGHSLLICDTGIDHRTANPNSFDLSNADFEWYDVSTQPSHMDIDSPTVPNLDKWYCYTLSFYVLHNRGFTSFALARVPIGKEEYLKKYKYTYYYTMYLPAGTFPMQQDAYKLPNSWIIYGVNCSVEAKRLWNILPPSIDAGWTHVGTIDHDKTRYFRSIRRKMMYLNVDGTMHLQDTNNSTEDFNTECIPSIIEMQHSAIDAQGTKATKETYDGVQPKIK